MNADIGVPQKVSNYLHPLIHVGAAGLLIWFVIAAWLLFGGSGYIELSLTMVTLLVMIAIGTPLALWRGKVAAQRSDAGTNPTENTFESLGTWLQGRFSTWTDQEKGLTAAIEILLPLAAVAFGMTALGIVLEIARAGAV